MWIFTHAFSRRLSVNECSSDISNWFEWLHTSDSREIYVCRCLGKFPVNQDQVYTNNTSYVPRILSKMAKYIYTCTEFHFKLFGIDSFGIEISSIISFGNIMIFLHTDLLGTHSHKLHSYYTVQMKKRTRLNHWPRVYSIKTCFSLLKFSFLVFGEIWGFFKYNF